MRFRIYHLLILLAVMASVSWSVDRYIHRFAIFEIVAISELNKNQPNQTVFRIDFEVTDGDYPYVQRGYVKCQAGFNQFLQRELAAGKTIGLVGAQVKIRYRDQAFLGLPPEGWGQRLSTHFTDVLLFPNRDEWQHNRFWRDKEFDKRLRARSLVGTNRRS